MMKRNEYVSVNKLNKSEKSVDGRYQMYSRNGKVEISTEGNKVLTTNMRGVVFCGDEFVCKGVDVPLSINKRDVPEKLKQMNARAQTLYGDDLADVVCIEEVYGSTIILAINLDGVVNIATNQKLNAYNSKYHSIFSGSVGESFGQIWENLMKKRGIYDSYIAGLASSVNGHIDVWYVCDESKRFDGVEDHLLKYGYSIIDGCIRICTSYNTSSVTYFDFQTAKVPASFSCLSVCPSLPFTVDNITSVKIVNDEYDMVNTAMGNNPCMFTRICQLVKFAIVSQQCIDDHYSRGRNTSGGDLERFQTMTNSVAMSHLKVLAKYSPTYTWSSIYLLSLMFDRVEMAYGNFVTNKVRVQNSSLGKVGKGMTVEFSVIHGGPNNYTAPHPQSFFAMTNRCLSNLYNKKRHDTTDRIRLTREEIEIEVLSVIPQDRIVREAALCLLDKLYAAKPSATTSITLGILNTVGSQTILVKVFGKVLQDFLNYENHFPPRMAAMIENPFHCRCGGIGTLFETMVDDNLKWQEAKQSMRNGWDRNDGRYKQKSNRGQSEYGTNDLQIRHVDEDDDGRLMISMEDYPPL